MMTIAQCRAARGLLDWTQQDLADASGLSKTAINNFEKGHSDIKNESLKSIRIAFENADVEFMPDGVRKKSETVKILKGPEAFNELFSDMFETLKDGGEILIAWFGENLQAHIPPVKIAEHHARMKELKITARVLCLQESLPLLSKLGTCRSCESDPLKSGMLWAIYGRKVALEPWNNAAIIIFNGGDADQGGRERFERLWNTAEDAGLKSGKEKTGLF